MRAVKHATPGLIENLSITQREIPVIKDNECLVKVYYSAINRADTLQRKGITLNNIRKYLVIVK